MTGDQQQTKMESRQARVGVVESRSGDKTVKVQVMNLVRHPRYGKYIRRRNNFAVHDPQNVAKIGDRVEIVPCRRLSKNKAWRLVRVIRSDQTPREAAEG